MLRGIEPPIHGFLAYNIPPSHVYMTPQNQTNGSFRKAVFETDRGDVSGNYVRLYVAEGKKTAENMPFFIKLRNALGENGAPIKLAKTINDATYEDVPSHITILFHDRIQQVIQTLVNYYYLPEECSQVIDAFSQSIKYAQSRVQNICDEQRQILDNSLNEHALVIRNEELDIDARTSYVFSTSNLFALNPSLSSKDLPHQLARMYPMIGKKSDSFYTSLAHIAKVYANMADLEESLSDAGRGYLPSSQIIQNIIREKLQ